MINENIPGVPKFESKEFNDKKNKYCLCIPIINEGERIKKQLKRSFDNNIHNLVDIVICDGDSTDGCTDEKTLKELGVNTLLVKKDKGKQSAQFRMGFWWALKRGYQGIITIDGNNKDSIEDVKKFIDKLDQGYDFIQGSRFIKGGKPINTPFIRNIAINLIHAPIISLTAKHRFTDTTNGFRGYSVKYIDNDKVSIFRNCFETYELLAYLSVRATQIGLKVCEVPVTREYPFGEKVPTKINFFSGNINLIKILIKNYIGKYNP